MASILIGWSVGQRRRQREQRCLLIHVSNLRVLEARSGRTSAHLIVVLSDNNVVGDSVECRLVTHGARAQNPSDLPWRLEPEVS